MNQLNAILLTTFVVTLHLAATEYHVATSGEDANPGSNVKPFKTISAAANKAMPGDSITVHAGVYRESVNPPRGGTSDKERITYQAAKGEKVTITGSDRFSSWQKVAGNTWKLVLPNTAFGSLNPYAAKVFGDWFNPHGRIHRRGNVFLNGDWLPEATHLNAITNGATPAWFSVLDGLVDEFEPTYMMNLAAIKVGGATAIPANQTADRDGPKDVANNEGGQCLGFISHGSWTRYDNVDFGTGTETIELRAAANASPGGIVEIRDGHPDGPLLGSTGIPATGGWQNWRSFPVKIKQSAGKKSIFLIFKSPTAAQTVTPSANSRKNTTIYVRLPDGVDPNAGAVEVSMRPTVFTPDKTEINYITVRGFDLRNAATNWAAPTMGQQGLVTAYWNKGWIIEDNEISYSRCAGIALGKYSDRYDGQRGTTEGYFLTIQDAFKEGWSKERIGSHIVRRNHIHHCGQVGIVGSLGCAFSQVIGNDIHDCNTQGIWSGFEQAGIKFHGAIDVVIADNHIWRNNGEFGGIWLDWMAQGTRITGNLLHDNGLDLFCEVNHGPIFAANNLFLSQIAFQANSQGGAFAHNLLMGSLNILGDHRTTPFMRPHTTEEIGRHNCPVGDFRWHNNLLGSRVNLATYDQAGADWPSLMGGNVFTHGAKPSRTEQNPITAPACDLGATLVKKADGWYLTLKTDPAWQSAGKRQLVTTELLGKAKIPNQGFTLPGGASMSLDSDYFGKRINTGNPLPGPFAQPINGEIKVWPKR